MPPPSRRVFGAASVLRHRAFGTGRFDLGNMTQAVWSTANGDFLSVTDVHGEQISRLGAHFDPILAALAPLWWLWPDPELLLVVQAVAVASERCPVYWLARKHLDSERARAALAVAYLLYPPTQWLTVSDFHPVALACPLLLFAWWYLDEDRLVAFALLAAVAMPTKEHVGLAVAAIGRLVRVRAAAPPDAASPRRHCRRRSRRRRRRRTRSVVPHFAAATARRRLAFESRDESPLARRPQTLRPRGVRYVPLAAPARGLPLAPLALCGRAGARGSTCSRRPHADLGQVHYAAVAIPALLAAAVFGAAPARPAPGSRIVVVAACSRSYALGPIRSGRVPGGETLGADDRRDRARPRAARAVALVPADAAVSATNSLGAHLSERRRIFSFPVLAARRTWVAVDERRLTLPRQPRRRSGDAPALARLRRDRGGGASSPRTASLVFRR